jgi:hypothetical protein
MSVPVFDLEELAGEVRVYAGRSAVPQLSGIILRIADKLLERVRRNLGRYGKGHGVDADCSDRSEGCDRVEAGIFVERSGDCVDVGPTQQQCVAVRSCGSDGFGANPSAGAGVIFHNDALAKFGGE